MRFKWVPEPPETVDEVASIHRAIPLVPASESTCLQRLRSRGTPLDTRDDATTWLTFLRALDAVDRTPSGYRRRRVDLTADLPNRLINGVYGARELYELLAAADEPLSVDALLERTVELPTWEQHHQTDPQRVHRRRQRRLADWLVLSGTAEKTATGYRLTETGRQ